MKPLFVYAGSSLELTNYYQNAGNHPTANANSRLPRGVTPALRI
jgi:hypothetical protein